jgi:hypothetical protein
VHGDGDLPKLTLGVARYEQNVEAFPQTLLLHPQEIPPGLGYPLWV